MRSSLDPTFLKGIGGAIAALGLSEFHVIAGIAAYAATAVYMIAKTVMVVRNNNRDD